MILYISHIFIFNLYFSSSNIINFFFTSFVKQNLTTYLNPIIPPSQLQHQSKASLQHING